MLAYINAYNINFSCVQLYDMYNIIYLCGLSDIGTYIDIKMVRENL